MSHFLLAGGGTAGHVEPALAVADALGRRHPDATFTFLGTAQGLETTLVPARGYDIALIPRVPLPRKLNKDLLTLPIRMRKAVKEIRWIMAQHNTAVVIGFGGYVALPAYLAARGRVPVVLHEANAKAGLANVIGARWADVVAEAFPGSLPHASHVGMPLRRSIWQISSTDRRTAASKWGLDPSMPTLLVIGGSQGARRINAAMRDSARQLLEHGVQVLHAVGKLNDDDQQVLSQVGPNYHAVPYIDDMASAYAAADLVVARSGAMTCAEVAACALPAVFVPYPVGNGEQRLNAAPLADSGAAVVVADHDFTGQTVINVVLPLLKDAPRRADMARAMKSHGMPDADEQMANFVDALMGSAKQ